MLLKCLTGGIHGYSLHKYSLRIHGDSSLKY